MIIRNPNEKKCIDVHWMKYKDSFCLLDQLIASDASNLLKLLASNFVNHRMEPGGTEEMPEVVIFPPFPFLGTALAELEGSGTIKVGAQNVGLQTSGAYTGEVLTSMIRSMGCDYVMLGHSERRALFDETEKDINAKMHLCLKEPNLSVILCEGETEEEYESDLLRSMVDFQIKKGLMGVESADLDCIVVGAYKPFCWAIGTGKVAKPEQAQVAHVVVRPTLSEMFGLILSCINSDTT